MGLLNKPKFVFENYGGSYQLRIRSAEDLTALDELDEPFWIATSAPLNQFSCDPVLLRRIDSNHNDRIHSSEIREAVRWLFSVLRDRQGISDKQKTLNLEALDPIHTEGKRLYETAICVLENLGESEKAHLSIDQIRDSQAIFSRGDQNGDGVIPPESITDPAVRAFSEDIIATVGSVTDINGLPGVNRELLETFIENAQELRTWQKQIEDKEESSALFPFGDTTARLYGLYKELAGPIDSFFKLCRIVEVNEILKRPIPEQPCPIEALESDDQANMYLGQAPLALPHTNRILSLKNEINPYYRKALDELTASVIGPILTDGSSISELDEEQWERVKLAFGHYEHWLEEKSGGQVEALGPEKLTAYLEGDLADRLGKLIDTDTEAGTELSSLNDLEYLILLQRWILDLCNNFVSFPHLYMPEQRAMFEKGRLVMDGTIFNFNLEVTDPDKHSAIAVRSGIYLIYSEVTGTLEDTPFYIVTPITGGKPSNLGVGKRGVLFDLEGHEWDTRVVKVVDNPVNVGTAIAAPFKRIAGIISSTAEKISSGAEQQLQAQLTQTGTSIEGQLKAGIATPQTAPSQPAAAPSPAVVTGTRSGGIRDLLLGGGVAIAALGSSFAFIAKTFSNMQWEHLVIAIVVGFAIILIPTMLVAFFKLRRRNLSAILEASGWAINAPMRITRGLSEAIVQKPKHPTSFKWLHKDLTQLLTKTITYNKND